MRGGDQEGVAEIEVTTYRIDVDYSNQRHPNNVEFTSSLEEDLARRDFTMNSLALSPASLASSLTREGKGVGFGEFVVVDPFGGLKDLNAKVIRAVGKPSERFAEDALRMLRAVRFAAQLNFRIEGYSDSTSTSPQPSPRLRRGSLPLMRGGDKEGVGTYAAIKQYAPAISAVSHERVRDELVKLVMSEQPEKGMNLLQQTGLLALLLPELAEGVGVEQNKHHIYTVFEHNIKSLQFAAEFGYPLPVRLAALLHDIGKPKTRRRKDDDNTFYGHDIVGAKMARNLLRRLKFSNELVEQISTLVRHHMFYYDVGKVTEAGARRLLRRVGGPVVFADLIKLRMAERKGSGVPKAEPYRLRHLQFLVEKAAQEPVSVGQLAIGGNDLIKDLGLRPSPLIGGILNALLAEVLDDPAKNTKDYLLQRADELKDKDPQELKALGSRPESPGHSTCQQPHPRPSQTASMRLRQA
jgi:poly(A) polymerase/tRNA nucleotidyltransferase (CCA-adding enzyme)